MSIEADVALLERVPTLRLLGNAALRVLAIGSEQREFDRGDVLFNVGDDADAGFVVQRGAFRVSLEDGSGTEIVAGPGTLIGELALVVAMERPSTALAIDYSIVIRIPRSLFQRVLDSDPAAALRLRDELASRASQIASDILMVGSKLTT
jgi:CRP-like cAMP-binding protein